MVEPKQDDQYHFTGFFSMSLTHIPGILEGTCSMLIYVQDFPKNIQKLQQVSFCCYGSPEILKTWKKFSKVAKSCQEIPKVSKSCEGSKTPTKPKSESVTDGGGS